MKKTRLIILLIIIIIMMITYSYSAYKNIFIENIVGQIASPRIKIIGTENNIGSIRNLDDTQFRKNYLFSISNEEAECSFYYTITVQYENIPEGSNLNEKIRWTLYNVDSNEMLLNNETSNTTISRLYSLEDETIHNYKLRFNAESSNTMEEVDYYVILNAIQESII